MVPRRSYSDTIHQISKQYHNDPFFARGRINNKQDGENAQRHLHMHPVIFAKWYHVTQMTNYYHWTKVRAILIACHNV